MTTNNRERKRQKTWSLLGDLRRVPSEYEVVTHKLNYHFRREPAPFELDTNAPLNRWYLTYRENSPFQVDDWEQFRDPYQFTYRRYVQTQNERETYVDGLVDQFERNEHDAKLEQGWVQFLEQFYLPSRFPGHALQMVSLYVGQMAPSSYITVLAHFQAADEVRRIQRLAYRAKSLSIAHYPELASTKKTCSIWETATLWQPLRELVEKLLIAYDWGEAFTGLNLVTKPIFDEVMNLQLAELARRNQDDLLALTLEDFRLDTRRSRDWSKALVQYAVQQKPELQEVLKGWVEKWTPLAHRAAEELSLAFGKAPNPLNSDQVKQSIVSAHLAFLAECNLG